MSIELNWQEGDDHPDVAWTEETEHPFELSTRSGTIAASRRPAPAIRLPSGRWLLLLIMPLAFVVAFGGAVLWNANQGNERARRDIEAVAQEALVARRQGNRELLSAVLDRRDPVWHDQVLGTLDAGTPGDLPRSVRVAEIDLDGYRAVATLQEIGEDGSTTEKLGFFRLYNWQWHLAQPWPEAFGEELTANTPHFRITYRQRDQPYVDDLVNLAERTYVEVCAELGCAPGGRAISLWLRYAGTLSEEQKAAGIYVLSPSLAGNDAAGSIVGESLRQELVRQLAVRITQEKAPEAAPAFWQAVGDWAASELAGAPLPGLPVLQEHLQAGKHPLPLDMVWREVVRDGNASNDLAGAQMRVFFSFVRWLAGDDALRTVLESGPRPFHELASAVFAEDLGTLEDQWRSWLATLPAPPS